MARFTIKKCLRHFDDDLLKQYFEYKNISKEFPERTKKVKSIDIQDWFDYINGLDNANDINLDFREIYQLADESGIFAIIELAREKASSFLQDIQSIENDYNKSLFCFLKYPSLFKNASILHYVTELKSKKERINLKTVKNIDDVLSKKQELTEAVSVYYQSEDGRGKNCTIDDCIYEDRVCFIVYIEDFMKSYLQHEKGKLVRKTSIPTFEIVYVYYNQIGRLELSGGNIGSKKELDLFNIFNQVVLEDKKAVATLQKVYDFDKFLLDKEFELENDIDNKFDYIIVKQMRLSHKFDKNKRIIFEQDVEGGLKPMLDLLEQHKIDKNKFNLTQVVINIKFPGKGNRGSVAMKLTYPDRCNLSDSPSNLKAKKYIKKWKLEINP